MKFSVLFLVVGCFALAAGYIKNNHSGGYNRKRGYKINDDSDCQLRLYKVRGFQGKPYVIRSDVGRVRALEKSVRTLGEDVPMI